MSEYRTDPPEPVCPRCGGPLELLDKPIQGRDKLCPACNLPCTGSPIEAQNHAAKIAAEQAARMADRESAARAAVARRKQP